MSQTESPIRAMFDAQRAAVKQSRQAVKQGLAFQRNTGKMTASAIRGQESMQRQSLELMQAAMQGTVDATTALTGGEQTMGQQQNIDQAFAQLKETHSEFYDVFEREFDRGIDSFDELSEEYVEALDEVVDQLLETHRTIEDETAHNTEEFSQQLLDQLERSQDVLDQLEDQFERQSERTEQLFERQVEGAEQYQQQLEEEAEKMQRQLRQQAKQAKQIQQGQVAAGASTGSPERLELIDGLGETFRDRLQENGITSIDELAASDPETVADAAEVSEERAQDWISQAEA